MNLAFSLLLGAAGGAAGWVIYCIVDRHSDRFFRHEQTATIGASALVLMGIALRFGSDPALAFTNSAFSLVLIAVTLFDFRTHEIPLWVTLPGTAAALVAGSLVLPLGFRRALSGLAFAAGILIVTTLVEALRHQEVGGGDWKYAAMIGAFLGWPDIVTALVMTGAFGFAGALALKAMGIGDRPIALGPWLSAGAISTLIIPWPSP